MLRICVSGFLVTVMPKVMNLPESLGNDLIIGKISNDGLEVSMTSVIGPEFTFLGP